MIRQPVPERVARHEIEEQEKMAVSFPESMRPDDVLGRHADARLALDALNQKRLLVAPNAARLEQLRNVNMLERVIFRLLRMRRPPDFAEAARADFIDDAHGLGFFKPDLEQHVFLKRGCRLFCCHSLV